jgi:hypothetical protein
MDWEYFSRAHFSHFVEATINRPWKDRKIKFTSETVKTKKSGEPKKTGSDFQKVKIKMI